MLSVVRLLSFAWLLSSCHTNAEFTASLRGSSSQLDRRLLNGRITGFQLMNSMTEAKVVDLANGTVVALPSGMSTPSFNIKVVVSGSDIKSIRFSRNGTATSRVATGPHFSFCGNDKNNFYKCDLLGFGTHTITATPYSNSAGWGDVGKPYYVTFKIANTATKAPTTKAPTTKAPTTKAPTTKAPTTKAPTTKTPVSKAPMSRAPVTPAPVAVLTPAPVPTTDLPPVPTDCDTLKACYLRNLGSGQEVLLSSIDTYAIDTGNPDGYSIRCDVNGIGNINFMKFSYDNKEHDEYGEPRWLDGDSDAGAYVVPVDYLSTCGTKTIEVQGHIWSGMCFQKQFSLTAQCNVPPTSAPIAPMALVPTMVPVSQSPVARAQNCSIPKLVGTWQSGLSHFPVAEAQGAFIGKDKLIVGGFLSGFANVSVQTNAFDTTNPSATWRRMDDYPFPIGVTHAAFVVVGMKFYMCGGYAGGGIGMHTDVCMVYDHSKPSGVGQQWSLFTPLPGGGRAGGHMVYDSTLKALIFSGGATRPIPQRRTAVDHRDTWMYSLNNPSSGWIAKAPMPFHANHMSAVTAKDSNGIERHYWTGGQLEENEHDGNISEHYEYDAVNNVWIARTFMSIPRSHHASSTRAVGCGFIVVAGCTNGGQKMSDISYYDTVSDTWTKLGDLSSSINTPVCDIGNNVLFCDTGWDSGLFSKKIGIVV